MVDYIGGTLQISAVFLSLIAGVFALSLFRRSYSRKYLLPWKFLIILLVLFSVEEIVGALVAFKVIQPTFITHLIPTLMLLLLIYALDLQIKLCRMTTRSGET